MEKIQELLLPFVQKANAILSDYILIILLVGVGLFLTYLCEEKCTCSELKSKFPLYHMSKNKIELDPSTNVDMILAKIADKFKNEQVTTIDGVKISFEARKEWVHLRRSNTEPIIRIYAESSTKEAADALAQQIIDIANKIIG